MRYNPHEVTRTEKLAFRLKDDKQHVQMSIVQRRKRNRAAKNHEILRYWTVKSAKRSGAREYVKDQATTIATEE